jgi:hypothetical protein
MKIWQSIEISDTSLLFYVAELQQLVIDKDLCQSCQEKEAESFKIMWRLLPRMLEGNNVYVYTYI